MINFVSQGILDDPLMSFLLGLIVVVVIGFALRETLFKKKQ
jgi:hypothetical protein